MLRWFRQWTWEQALIVIVAVVALAAGANWGLPDTRRVSVLLYGQTLTDQQKSELVAARQRKSEEREAWRGEVAEKIQQGQKVGVFRNEYDADAVLSEDQKFFALGSYLLNGSAHDEGQTYHALASMNPGRLDFNPHMFIYGGSYLYPLGASIFALKTAGLITVTRDYSLYLAEPWHIARMYLAGRWLNILAFVGILLLLARIGWRMGGRMCAAFAMIAWLFSTLALDQTLISKPHIYAAFWALLSFYILVRRPGEPSWKSILASGASAGMAMGAALPCFMIAIPLAFLVVGRSRRTWIKLVVLGAVMASVFAITNPYIFIDFNEFRITLHGHSTSDGYGYGMISLAKLRDFCASLFMSDYAFPASLIGGAAMIVAAVNMRDPIRKTAFPTSRLAIGTILMILGSGLSMAVARIALYVGPLICLFTGLGLAWIWRTKWVGPVLAITILMPCVFFAGLSIRDAAFDEAWYEPEMAWLQQAKIGPNTTFGIFGSGQPHPATLPPFPFINSQVINLNKYQSREIQPDYVLVNLNEMQTWDGHPLRSNYKPAVNLGNRPSYHWLTRWRVPSQARTAAQVFEKNAD